MKKILLALVCLGSSASAAVIQINLTGRAGSEMLPGNEIHAVNGVPGGPGPGTGGEILGGILFDDVSNLLTLNVGWGSGNGFTNLTGTASLYHIHQAPGPDGLNTAGGVVIDFTGNPNFTVNSSATNGSIIGAQVLTAPLVTALNGGLLYVNVHTQINGQGEMRGNLILIPEPSSVVALGLAGALAGLRRRRV